MTRHRPVLVLAMLVIGLAQFATVAEDHAFVGTKKCKMCHMKQYKSWAETKMAKAYEVLKPGERAEAKTEAGLDPNKDYTTDQTCLQCHTTGFGKASGFSDIDSTPALAGVGCEMCHGAGGSYVQVPYMTLKNKEYKKAEIVAAGLVDQVSEEQCRNCHNTDSPFVGPDYVFDFGASKDKATHEKFTLKYQH